MRLGSFLLIGGMVRYNVRAKIMVSYTSGIHAHKDAMFFLVMYNIISPRKRMRKKIQYKAGLNSREQAGTELIRVRCMRVWYRWTFIPWMPEPGLCGTAALKHQKILKLHRWRRSHVLLRWWARYSLPSLKAAKTQDLERSTFVPDRERWYVLTSSVRPLLR